MKTPISRKSMILCFSENPDHLPFWGISQNLDLIFRTFAIRTCGHFENLDSTFPNTFRKMRNTPKHPTPTPRAPPRGHCTFFKMCLKCQIWVFRMSKGPESSFGISSGTQDATGEEIKRSKCKIFMHIGSDPSGPWALAQDFLQ